MELRTAVTLITSSVGFVRASADVRLWETNLASPRTSPPRRRQCRVSPRLPSTEPRFFYELDAQYEAAGAPVESLFILHQS